MPSGLIIDYLGSGVIADRPASLDLYAGSLGLWFATDTDVLSLWDGSGWTDVTGSAVNSVNGATGAVVLALDDIDDVDAASPSDGDVLTWSSSASAWEPAAGSGGGGSGDVNGPASSVDNTLPRFDGTSGKTLQGSGVAVTDSNEISGYRGHLNQQTGTTYTLQPSDSGKIVELTNAASIALTADPTLPQGFACTVVQGGAGQVTIASSGSGSVVNRQSQFKTAGNNAMCALYVRSNSGSNAVFVLAGDTAA